MVTWRNIVLCSGVQSQQEFQRIPKREVLPDALKLTEVDRCVLGDLGPPAIIFLMKLKFINTIIATSTSF